MEIVVIFAIILLFLIVLVALPDWITQRCPICNGRMEFTGKSDELHRWNGWTVVSRQYTCRECLYRRNRVEIKRFPQGGQHETRPLH